jgi:hypothetical protein
MADFQRMHGMSVQRLPILDPTHSRRKVIEMKIIFSAALLLATYTALAAPPDSLTGKWTIHSSISGNESDMTCTFTRTDAKLTGSCKGDKDTPITGSVDGSKVTWKFDTEHDGTPLTLTYTGTLSDSEKFAGNVDVQPYGITGDFTATPSKEPSK